MIYSEFINQTISNNNQILWNYYRYNLDINNILQSENSRIFIHDYFENGAKVLPMLINPESARNYINDYFATARKEYALSFDFGEQNQLPDDRAIHTVSAFFLGLLIENCLNGEDTLRIESNNNFPFSYLWFLTCLYHDYGYCVAERDNTPFSFPNKAPMPCECYTRNLRAHPSEYRALARVKKDLGIDLSPFSSFPRMFSSRYTEPLLERAILRELTLNDNKISRHNRLHFNTNSAVSATRYDSSTIVRYFNYCINERKRVDHGIIGGFLFYDRMIKNYMLAYVTAMQECNHTPRLSDFEYRDRHFCAEQLIIFSYIADCILSHNVFKQQDDQRALYEKYKLNSLYSENFQKINYKDNPLLYILAITDSIEPTKIYRTLSTPMQKFHQVFVKHVNIVQASAHLVYGFKNIVRGAIIHRNTILKQCAGKGPHNKIFFLQPLACIGNNVSKFYKLVHINLGLIFFVSNNISGGSINFSKHLKVGFKILFRE